MPSHYQHPELYAALLDPDGDEWANLDPWIERARDPALGRVSAVIDPACGPGGYLLRWVREGASVLGLDLEPAMVTFARQRLHALYRAAPGGCVDEAGESAEGRPSARAGVRVEVERADMRRPNLAEDRFDLALNLNAAIGHLADDAAVASHLRGMRRGLRLGAGYLLDVTLQADGALDDRAQVLWDSPWVPLDDGSWGALSYTSVQRDPSARTETVVVTRLHRGDGTSDDENAGSERYVLHTHTPSGMRQLSRAAGFQLLAWVDTASAEEVPATGLTGDAIAVLRAV